MNKIIHGKITKNKYYEIQLATWEATKYFSFNIVWSYKGDHCGFTIDIEIYKLNLNATIYDTRHWDYDKDCFVG